MTEYQLSDCAICGEPAHFTDASPGANPVSYCSGHLPAHMQTAAAAGQMALSVENTTVADLREQASELDIEGRSSMAKEELAEAVSEAHAEQLDPEPAPVEQSDAPVGAPEVRTAAPQKKAARRK